MPIRLAVFDIAGTTVKDDNGVATSFAEAFSSFGFTVTPEMVNPLMGYKKTEAIRIVLEKMGEEPTEQLIDEIHDLFDHNMQEFYRTSGRVEPMPDAEKVFMQLKQNGTRIALNTGFSRAIADAIVERLQWQKSGFIDDYIGSSDVENGRPDPAMIHWLMQRSGITDAAEVAKIGDTEVDIREGRNAGCALVVAVTTGAFTRAELEPYSPDHIINELSELPALIKEIA